MSQESEQKIQHECHKVLKATDTPDFQAAVHDLRLAISDHLNSLRETVADYAVVISTTSGSKAAD